MAKRRKRRRDDEWVGAFVTLGAVAGVWITANQEAHTHAKAHICPRGPQVGTCVGNALGHAVTPYVVGGVVGAFAGLLVAILMDCCCAQFAGNGPLAKPL